MKSDVKSTYRQARLVLQVPSMPGGRAYYSLHVVGVRNGVPTAKVLVDGHVRLRPLNPTTEEILEALQEALAQSML